MDLVHVMTPDRNRKASRSEVHVPLQTARKHRLPSTTETRCDGQISTTNTTQRLSVRVRASPRCNDSDKCKTGEKPTIAADPRCEKLVTPRNPKTLQDLPLEIQGLILDEIFGDLHSVTKTSTSLRPGIKAVSSAMRHPRRKALTDVALVSPTWRDLVQERIYRHSEDYLAALPPPRETLFEATQG
jgi:hypothetical protein